jgi:hypothetical protein
LSFGNLNWPSPSSSFRHDSRQATNHILSAKLKIDIISVSILLRSNLYGNKKRNSSRLRRKILILLLTNSDKNIIIWVPPKREGYKMIIIEYVLPILGMVALSLFYIMVLLRVNSRKQKNSRNFAA